MTVRYRHQHLAGQGGSQSGVAPLHLVPHVAVQDVPYRYIDRSIQWIDLQPDGHATRPGQRHAPHEPQTSPLAGRAPPLQGPSQRPVPEVEYALVSRGSLTDADWLAVDRGLEAGRAGDVQQRLPDPCLAVTALGVDDLVDLMEPV